LSFEIYGGIWLRFVGKASEMPREADFQAEYEGSIPFTRSNNFNGLGVSSSQDGLFGGAVREVAGIGPGAFSGNMKVSFQAARSIG
jgi:hypothetical protein